MSAAEADEARSARLGVRTDGDLVFTCSACGSTAATLRASRGPAEVEIGPETETGRFVWRPTGPHYVRRFLGVSTGLLSERLGTWLADAVIVDPLELAAADPDLAGFCCRECGANYCEQCWTSWMEFDESFYDCTRGLCPRGHEQILDD